VLTNKSFISYSCHSLYRSFAQKHFPHFQAFISNSSKMV
jgi:hypothetical protein